jgi:hypothetical protein
MKRTVYLRKDRVFSAYQSMINEFKSSCDEWIVQQKLTIPVQRKTGILIIYLKGQSREKVYEIMTLDGRIGLN